MSLYNDYYREDLKGAIQNTYNFHELKEKSILITGATGLIGSFIIDMLLYANEHYNMNINILAMGRSLSRLKERFNDDDTNPFLCFIEHDINDEIVVDESTDYIIHAAGNAYPAAFSQDPIGTVMGSIVGTRHLLEYAKAHMMGRFLFVSSGEVYGQGQGEEQAFKEDFIGGVDSMKVRSCYPLGKQVAENLCLAYHERYKLETIIVRPCHIYGPNITDSDNRATAEFIRAGISEENIVMKSEGRQVRSYCYIGDCASAILTVLLKGKAGEAYNIAHSEAKCSIKEFAMEVASEVDKPIIYNEMNVQEKMEQTPITRAVLDTTKLQSLGWNGKFNIKQGIKHTIKILSN